MKKWFCDYAFVFVFLFFATLGEVLGVLSLKNADEKTVSLLSSLTGGFIKNSLDVSQHFFSSIGSDMLILVFLYSLGFSIFALPIISLTVMFCGVGVGVSVGFLYATYGSGALLYTAVLILPSAIMSLITLVFAGHSSMKMSGFLFKRTFSPQAPPLTLEKFTKYSLQFLSFSCILILSGILDTALNRIFSSVIIL